MIAVFSTYFALSQGAPVQLYQNGYYIKQYTESNGLVSNKCKYLFEDSKGFLWISTFQGLSKFDGHYFTNFGLKDGLPSLNISQVCEDSAGIIYVATAKGIVRYTGRRANSNVLFSLYKETTSLNSITSGMQVIDSSTIIFQQINQGLFLLKNNKLSVLSGKQLPYEMSIFKDKKNNIYAYCRDTFFVYDRNLNKIRNINFRDSGFITFYYDNINNHFNVYSNRYLSELDAIGFKNSRKAPDSVAWFWATGEENKMFYSKNRTDLCYYDGNITTNILDLKALSLYSNDLRQTADGSVWITTNNGGIFKITALPYRAIEIKTFAAFENAGNKNVLNPDTELANVADIKDIYTTLKNTSIKSVFISRDKTAWFCCSDGIYKKMPAAKTEHYVFPGNEKLYGPASKEIRGVVEDSSGNLWFYGYCGLVCYSKGKFKQYTNRDGLPEDVLVRQLVKGKNDIILLTDWYNIFKVRGDTIIPVSFRSNFPSYIPNKIETDILGAVWVDYNKKLYKIESLEQPDFKITDSIILSPVIPVNDIATFKFDNNNNCWVGYNGGKVQVFIKNKDGHYSPDNTVSYTIGDGLAPVTGNGRYDFFNDPDGNIGVLSAQGDNGKLFIFSGASVIEQKKINIPRVYITEILITQNTPVDPGSNPSNSLVLTSEKDDIAFEYTAISFRTPENIIYQIKLQEYNKDWITTTQTSVNFANLAPGDYTFLVRAANVNGVWSDPTAYKFSILPPWYKSWWAWLLWIILAVLFILFILLTTLRIARNKDSLKHLKRDNEFKTLLISLLGHDMMIPLQYIGKVAFQLRKYNQKMDTMVFESLGDIYHTASQLQLYSESIIHWIKAKNNELKTSEDKPIFIIAILRELVTFHSPLCNEKGNTLLNECDTDLLSSYNPFLIKIILHNLILNANKFTANGKILIKASQEDNWLILTVADNGRGMDKEKVDFLNNLVPLDSNPGTNMELGWGLGYIIIIDLIKFAKGSLHVESILEQGTAVNVKLPVLPNNATINITK